MGDRPTITTTDGFLILIVTVMYKNNMKTRLFEVKSLVRSIYTQSEE